MYYFVFLHQYIIADNCPESIDIEKIGIIAIINNEKKRFTDIYDKKSEGTAKNEIICAVRERFAFGNGCS